MIMIFIYAHHLSCCPLLNTRRFFANWLEVVYPFSIDERYGSGHARDISLLEFLHLQVNELKIRSDELKVCKSEIGKMRELD